jgi:tRNA (mo5U34)-methyltransferase
LLDPSKRDITIKAGLSAPLKEGESSRRTLTFDLAHRALESSVQFRDLSIYDLSPAEIGEFDFVFMGSLLVHLRDPVLALTAVRSVTRGELLSYDAVSPSLTFLHPRTPTAKLRGLGRAEWWLPNVAGMRRIIASAGFRIIRSGGISYVPRSRRGFKPGTFTRHPVANATLYLWGIAQCWVESRPKPS